MSSGFRDASTLVDGTRLSPAVCIIGSGAGGAVAAYTLAAAGHDVLVVEEGGYRTRVDFKMREDVAFRTLYQEGGIRTTRDAAITILQGRTVGGSTVVNWTTCFRTPEPVIEHWRQHHGVALTRAMLDPHYDIVEKRLHIEEWPLERSNTNNRLLYDGCQALGVDVAPTRRNVKQCLRTGYCGSGCPTDAKQSMLLTYLPDAVARGAQVLYRLRIERLEITGGRVVAAHGQVLGDDGKTPTGARIVIAARTFILSAGAIHSPGILLRSGLGGSGSPVGRRTFIHPVIPCSGRYKDHVEAYYGPPQSVAAHGLAERGKDIGVFLEAAPAQPVLGAAAATGQGQAHAARMRELPYLSGHIALAIDGFSPDEPGGVVAVHRSGAAFLDYRIVPRVWEGLRTGLRTLVRANLAAGAELVYLPCDPPLVVRSEAELNVIDQIRFQPGSVLLFTAHLMGGCPMGADPATSVVRGEDLRHHRLPNLHVIDGSVFPTSLGVNPQLSIYGLAHLVASRLAQTIGTAAAG